MCGCNGCCASISTVAWYCTYLIVVVLLYTRQGWRSQGTGPSIDLAPPHKHEPIGGQQCTIVLPKRGCRPPFSPALRPVPVPAANPVPGLLVWCFLPAGAHCPEVPSLPVALAADPNSLSTSPQIRSAQGCRPEQTTTRTRTTTSTVLLLLLFFGVFGPGQASSPYRYPTPVQGCFFVCPRGPPRPPVTRTINSSSPDLGCYEPCTAATRAQPRSIPTEHGVTSIAQPRPSQIFVLVYQNTTAASSPVPFPPVIP